MAPSSTPALQAVSPGWGLMCLLPMSDTTLSLSEYFSPTALLVLGEGDLESPATLHPLPGASETKGGVKQHSAFASNLPLSLLRRLSSSSYSSVTVFLAGTAAPVFKGVLPTRLFPLLSRCSLSVLLVLSTKNQDLIKIV